MILIVGDSHVSALRQALVQNESAVLSTLRERFGDIAVRMLFPGYKFADEFFTFDRHGINLKFGARDRLAVLMGNSGLIRREDPNIFGFSCGFHASVMIRQKYWEQFTILNNINGKDYISNSAFRKIVLDENKYVIAFAQALKDTKIKSFFIVPPPLRQAMISRQAEYTSAEELLAIRQAYVTVMFSVFDQMGVSYVAAPATCTEMGILKQKYDQTKPTKKGRIDVHHANVAYGQLMWRVIARHCLS